MPVTIPRLRAPQQSKTLTLNTRTVVAEEPDGAEALDKVVQAFTAMKKCIIGRDEEIDAIMLAILTGHNVLMKGKPGTAKSMLASIVFRAFSDDFSKFKCQVTKDSKPEALFGPLDISRYQKNAEYVYNTKGMLPEAHLAFLDEFLDGNDALLRSVLNILNEREFNIGTHRHPVPLMTAIATTNFAGAKEALEAVKDRFLFRIEVRPMDGTDRLSYLRAAVMGFPVYDGPVISMSELKAAQETVKECSLDDTLLTVYDRMLSEFCALVGKTGLAPSDRRIAQALQAIRAQAAVSGEESATEEHLSALRHVIIDIGSDLAANSFGTAYNKSVSEAIKVRALVRDAEMLRDKVVELSEFDFSTFDGNRIGHAAAYIHGLFSAVTQKRKERAALPIQCSDEVLLSAEALIHDVRQQISEALNATMGGNVL